jgi:hypothetical protein
MAQDHWAHAKIEVDKTVAIDVEQVGSLGTLEDKGRRRDVEAEVAVHTSRDPSRIGLNSPSRFVERHRTIIRSFPGGQCCHAALLTC